MCTTRKWVLCALAGVLFLLALYTTASATWVPLPAAHPAAPSEATFS